MACGLAVAGSSMTSAYFSDTNTGGAITASYGSIFVDVDGNKVTTPNLDLSGLLPGESRTGEFNVKNSGKSAQDAWVSFDSDAVLKAVNSLGRSAAIEIKVAGERVFFSGNLNDDPEDQGQADIMPLPKQLKLASGLAAGESVKVEFSFYSATTNSSQLIALIPVTLPYSVIATQVGIAPGL